MPPEHGRDLGAERRGGPGAKDRDLGARTDRWADRAVFAAQFVRAPVLAHRLAHRLAQRHPRAEVVPADVAELPALLALRGLGVVVSGLGWSATRPGGSDSLLPTIAGALHDDGVPVQFAHTWTQWAPPARALRSELDDCFAEVAVSPVVWRNLPPAVVYRAHRPRRRRDGPERPEGTTARGDRVVVPSGPAGDQAARTAWVTSSIVVISLPKRS